MSRPFLLRTLLALGVVTVAVGAASAPAHAVPSRTVRVMSFNIHHGANAAGMLDLAAVAKVIADSGADVVGLQEVDRHWSERSDWLDEAAWLGERLGMHVAYAANLDQDPATPGAPRRQYGTAVLSRYPILESGNTLLTKGGDPTTEQRGLLYARVMVRGVPLRFYDTHLQHTSAPVRQAQADQITGLIGTGGGPMVLTGDLNAEPAAAEITTLTARYTDTWPATNPDDPGLSYPSEAPHARIDYVLSTATPTAATVLPVVVSDHRPVLTTLTVRR